MNGNLGVRRWCGAARQRRQWSVLAPPPGASCASRRPLFLKVWIERRHVKKTIKRSSGESKRSHKKKTTNPAAAPSGVSRPSRRGREVFEVNLSALLEEEAVSRHLLSSLLIVEQSSLLEYLFLIMNEDVERYNITWLAEQQAVSAAHEHVFTFVKNIEKYPNYHEGFVCDMCDYDFLPTGKNKTTLHFYHCLCGRDFCEFCYPEYKKKCTCTCCKKVHPNSVALRDHLVKMKNVKQTIRKAVDPKGRSSIQSPSLSPRASVKPSPSPSPPRKSDKHKTTAAAATKKAKTKATRQSPPAKSASPLKSPLKRGDPKRSHKKRPPITTVVEKDEDEDLLLPNTSHMSIAAMVQTSNKRTPRGDSGRLKTVEKVAEGPWRPLAKLKSERESTKQLNQPTPQEREALLHGEWIRHFYYYPPDDTEFYALVYHAQPGRTGSVFLSTDYTIHSSILSPLERQLFIVEETDVNEGNDITRVYSLAQARANRDVNVLFQDMQAIATHDTNMLKQHRAPVRMAVYQTARSAYSCNGDPYLYIRWFRSNADGSLFIFLLSNGAVQAFVGGEYEIRWFDEHRKFIIRPNGICEKNRRS
ncbi:hypothetical protein AGDE_13003 [Angomonas deanei]|uniref:Uncharacterized protein n=1 Tax=Angomonas deanei TaxID=59799 RepID=A0A7G2CB01_9TRYP|nr:hypothetical protein AGDE_13003 [Angomonas deanei]CAD2216625.1 hypothetical protein, conserved [Angomonas deanei]|eukprot:EPY23195.1 hypothetical protein AGDE_13003 [Angomonas deanei]